jgi:hypothetical protein
MRQMATHSHFMDDFRHEHLLGAVVLAVAPVDFAGTVRRM